MKWIKKIDILTRMRDSRQISKNIVIRIPDGYESKIENIFAKLSEVDLSRNAFFKDKVEIKQGD